MSGDSKSTPPGFVSHRAIGRQSGKGVPLFQLLDLFIHLISSRMQKIKLLLERNHAEDKTREGLRHCEAWQVQGPWGEVASSGELPPSLLGTWCRSRRQLAGGISRNATRANASEHLPSTPTGLSCSWRFQREEWWVRWLQLGREQQVPSGGGASCAHSSGRRGLLPPDQRPLSRLGGGSHGCVSSEDSSGSGRKRGPVQSFRPCLKPPVWKAIPTYPNPISSPPQPTGYI